MPDEVIGVVVAAHGRFASGLLSAVEVIIGTQDALTAVDLGAEESPEGFGERLAAASGGHPAGTLFLTDLPGATPFKAAARLARDGTTARVVAGVNLPMLLEVLMGRGGRGLAEIAETAGETGRAGVVPFDPGPAAARPDDR